ncbi:DNA translocase FtsK [Bartonella bacilliformis]|uniref:DNA translocase FtsK n=2 Tax=Bartonella bacilliformis TaxID=774 RepID=A1UR28_BARBK|nr:DNA translocase FtsK [Bartonella bacilliformis]ABM44650.1 FtsK/SpoIIIE family protein [Bartonella bacilliformis KC583]AMG85324.1 DNA translocase FtsK [Bartonella bacilliformis]EKS45989.1 FtsK/SpoIIIE family protein [Bartonella bacilliformis INS]EYS88772.1 DNA translocase ftsK [Bartonella bacilliformis San Pedro600-02]KZN22190.1 cell division protein FtsK [Bartonella bacilliformis]
MHQDSSSHDLSANQYGQSSRLVKILLYQIGAFIGLVLFSLIIFCVVSLATWNVADPSLTRANMHKITNLMGRPGAVFSDLFMQFFGLASLCVLLPPFFWSLLLMVYKDIQNFMVRLCWWVVSIICLSAFFSLMTPLASWTHWPLPIGLGGVVGDKVIQITFSLFPALPSFLQYVLWGCFFVFSGFLTAVLAGNVVWRNKNNKRKKTPRVKAVEPIFDMPEEVEHTANETRLNFFATIFGAILHLFYYLQACCSRLFLLSRKSDKKNKILNRVEPVFYDEDKEPDHKKVPVSASKSSVKSIKVSSKGNFTLPLLDYLAISPPAEKSAKPSAKALKENSRELEAILLDFGVKGKIIDVRPGPVVTLYEFEPAAGIKSSRIIGLADDIARSMRAISARVAVVPGRNVIGIELPNATREMVYLRDILQSQEFLHSKAKLVLALGKTIGGETVIADLAKMPHLLVAGTTGAGKSVAINTMILSLLYRMTPEQCRLIMVDPKMLELSVYDGIPHLLTPVVTDPKKAVIALKWAVREMEERYSKMSKMGVRNIDSFNARLKEAENQGETLTRTIQVGFDHDTGQPLHETETLHLSPMPYIVIIIDEMADLMLVAGKEIEGAVQRLAQMARAAGIHVIMATQRPSVDVITGTIKANFPTRISFFVSSKIDSRTILGEQGAEQLLGQGDMLFMMGGGRIQRVHGPFVADNEVEQVVAHLKTQAQPDYLETITQETTDQNTNVTLDSSSENDPYTQAVAVVLRDRKASTSYIQRRLGIGYNRAASLIERMEEEGIISPANHAGKREILVPPEQEIL